jgi:hypothetical protein
MRKTIALLFLLLLYSISNAQADEQILNEILFDLFGFQQDSIYMENIKTRTSFEYDSISFEKMTGLTIPSEIISEWKQNEENNDFVAEWSEQNLNKTDFIYFANDTIIAKKPVFKLLTQSEIDQIFERTKKRQYIYSISNILFDNSQENALFHFSVKPWPGEFRSETILVKKVFGKWRIIERFDFGMS